MRKHYDKAFWLRHVSAANQCSFSKAEYCRRNGLNAKTFCRWAQRLRSEESAVEPTLQALVPVSVRTGLDASTTRLNLQLGSGAVLQLPGSVDARWLGRMLREMVSC